MKTSAITTIYDQYVMPTYPKTPLALVKGNGSFVSDAEGNMYLDFFPGWSVSGIGHCHPRVVKAIQKQVKTLIHVSNNYYHEWQGVLAKKLIEHSFPGKVFFCNSGAEANEAAFKLARKWGNPAKNEIIAMKQAFHGRTLATITATGQPKYLRGFEPLPPGFMSVPFNDLAALESAITEKTAAIILEPIQGEGGIRVADAEYLKAVRALCDKQKILLIFDEVQTGMGKTGEMFAFQHFGIEPDILTLAKTLGGGFPIGAMIAKRAIADTLGPGSHASTFGGSPLACAAALATIEAIEKEKLLANAKKMGSYLKSKLMELKKKHAIISEVRGVALMLGMELKKPGAAIYEACLKSGLLINCTQENVLRIMPPITVTKKEIDSAIGILDKALAV